MISSTQKLIRQAGLGGSDAPVIVLGAADAYGRTRYQLYQEKIGAVEPDDLDGVDAVALGAAFEPAIRGLMSERLGARIHQVHQTLIHPEHQFMQGHLDGRIVTTDIPALLDRVPELRRVIAPGENVIVEIKNRSEFQAKRYGPQYSDEVLGYDLVQTHHYMAVAMANAAIVGAVFGGRMLRIYAIRRDDDLARMIIDLEKDFWDRVLRRDPPDPTDEADARDRWRAHQPGKTIEVMPDVAQAISDLAAVKARMAELEKAEKALRDTVIPAIGDADTVTFGGRRLCTYRANAPSRRLDHRGLAESVLSGLAPAEREARLAAFTREVPGPRVLRLDRSA